MKDFVKTYFTVAWIASLVFAILYAITIVGIVLSIPLFIAMNRYKSAVNYSDEELVEKRKSLLGWGIFLSIALSSTGIGLIVALVLTIMVNSHIENIEKGDVDKVNKGFGETVKEGTKNTLESIKEGLNLNTSLEDQLAEIDRLKENGTITEEEYQIKRQSIINGK